jgi:hypothetical protein
MSDPRPLDHLTAQEVEIILQYIEQVDAILVGGQSLAIWARLFLSSAPQIARVYSISSEDVDVYANSAAAKAFAAKLRFRLDLRLNRTWRAHQLAGAIERLKIKTERINRTR